MTVQGALTVNGNLIFTGDVAITIPDEELQAYSITEGTEDYVSINTRSGEESVTFGQQPNVIIANTVKGKGVSFMENNNLWHYKNPNLEELKRSLLEINKKYA